MTEKKTEINCPVSATIQLIGGKYKALILWHLMDNTMRFSQLRKLVPAATPKMLTQQLRELEADGLLDRTVYPVVPPKVEYSLTEKGRSIRPILQGMYSWGTELLKEEGLTPNCTMTETAEDTGCQDSCCSRQGGEGDTVLMDIETYSRREEELALAARLLEAERQRMAGAKGYSLDDLEESLSRTISMVAEDGVKYGE